MKFSLLIAVYCLVSFSYGQNDTISWNGYYSYFKVKQIERNQGELIVAAENSFFKYDLNNGNLKKFSTVQGLSGDEISVIKEVQDNNLILIGYQNGLIQVLNTITNEIKFVVDILDTQTISPDQKQINQFIIHENLAYIATDFGIATYNLENLEFNDTFFIGDSGQEIIVNQITIQNDIIYAATIGGGIRYANLDNPNLIDFNEWQAVNSSNYKFIQNLNDEVYVMQFNNTLLKINDDFTLSFINTFNFDVREMRNNQNSLLIVGKEQVINYNTNGQSTIIFSGFDDETSNMQSALLTDDNRLFLGDEALGLIEIDMSNQPKFLSPNGPLQNRIFNIAVSQNEIWAVYGEYSIFYNPFPLNRRGISHFKNGEWINQSVDDINNLAELSHITIDPQNRDRVYISSFFDGLLVIENDSLVQNYNADNSAVEGVTSNSNDNRVGSSVFVDDQLFFTNSLTESPLKSLNRDGDFQLYDTSDGLNNPLATAIAKVVASSSGNLYFSTIREGIIAYNPETDESEAATSADTGVDFPDVFDSNPNITALRFDNNGNLWIGTNRGLRVFFNPSAVFDPDARLNISPIIFDDDGTPQELLFEQTITDIQVDGANNKWIATSSSGVFQVSPNGQQTLNRFTKDNSPLPSDQVISLGINGDDGRVFFATTRGLVSFQTRVTNASEDLSDIKIFPNPIKPNFNGLVTIEGLTDDANVKITDITGNLVFEEESNGGSIQWDTRAFGNHKVASGVYLVLITGADQMETKLEKIMVIR